MPEMVSQLEMHNASVYAPDGGIAQRVNEGLSMEALMGYM
jgi:hypothetical protein